MTAAAEPRASLAIVSPVAPLRCPDCGKTYKHAKRLANHQRDVHRRSVEPVEQPAAAQEALAQGPAAWDEEAFPIIRGRACREPEPLTGGDQTWAVIIDDLPGGPGMTVIRGVTYTDVQRTLSVIRTFGFRAGATRLLAGARRAGEPAGGGPVER